MTWPGILRPRLRHFKLTLFSDVQLRLFFGVLLLDNGLAAYLISGCHFLKLCLVLCTVDVTWQKFPALIKLLYDIPGKSHSIYRDWFFGRNVIVVPSVWALIISLRRPLNIMSSLVGYLNCNLMLHHTQHVFPHSISVLASILYPRSNPGADQWSDTTPSASLYSSSGHPGEMYIFC